MHTCSIGGVDHVGASIGLLSLQFTHLARQVLSGPRIHVPVRINGVGLSFPLRLGLLGLRRRTIRHSDLTASVARIFAVNAKAKEAFLKTAVTLGRPVTIIAAELALAAPAIPR
jgi:hypothetical protein